MKHLPSIVLLTASTIFTSIPVLASGFVSLDCEVIPNEKYKNDQQATIRRLVKLDEGASKVVVTETRRTGKQYTKEYKAVFSSEKITWNWHFGHGIGIAYEIDRTTGAYQNHSMDNRSEVGATGSCKLVESKKKLF